MWFKNFYSGFNTIKNLLRQPADPSQVDHQEEYIRYGENDNFPLKLAKLIEESPTGSACISTWADFIEGNGFSLEELGDVVVNSEGETFSSIHNKCSDSFAINEGFYINVKYSKLGNKTEFYVIPFENCRLGLPNKQGKIQKIYVNPYFGTDLIKRKDTKCYDTYNPNPEVIAAQIREKGNNYLGQILFVGTTKALHRFYPESKYYSAAKWFEVDKLIGEYWKNNLDNNFLQSVVFKIVGDPSAPSKDPNHQIKNETTGEYEPNPEYTVGRAWSEMMSDNFSGAQRVGNIMTFWANSKDEFPDMQAFPSDAKAEVFKVIEEMTAKKITVATKIPGILANISNGVNLGSDGAEIQAAVKLVQQRAVKVHHLLERTYVEITKDWKDKSFEGKDFNIVHYDPYPEDVTVDEKIWNELTPEERREWIRKNTDIVLIAKVEPEQPAPNPSPTPQPNQPPPPPGEAKKTLNPKGVLYDSYPDKAKTNAARALKHKETSSVRCGSKFAWDIALLISEGKPINYKQVKRIGNYLKKTEQYKNNTWNSGCEAVLYHSWGGKEMQDWCEAKVTEVG